MIQVSEVLTKVPIYVPGNARVPRRKDAGQIDVLVTGGQHQNSRLRTNGHRNIATCDVVQFARIFHTILDHAFMVVIQVVVANLVQRMGYFQAGNVKLRTARNTKAANVRILMRQRLFTTWAVAVAPTNAPRGGPFIVIVSQRVDHHIWHRFMMFIVQSEGNRFANRISA